MARLMVRKLAVFATVCLSSLFFLRTAYGQTSSLGEALSRARASAEELAVVAELAAAQREIGSTSSRFASGPVVGVAAGPRRSSGSVDPDVGVDLDLPLLPRSNGRSEAVLALQSAEKWLPQAARLETRGRIASAWIALWRANQEARLREEDVATVERWFSLAKRRLEQGAEARFEVELIALDLEQAKATAREIETARIAARSELALWTDPLPEAPAEDLGDLASNEPPAPAAPILETVAALVERPATEAIASGLLSTAIGARRELKGALARFERARSQSRWALRSSLAREADESVAHFGVTYRFPLAKERSSVADALDAEVAAIEREANQRLAELAARFAVARAVWLTGPALGSSESPTDVFNERTLAALELRLAEGKARPSEALLLRRSVLAAEVAQLERLAARLAAAWEIVTLTTEELP